MSIAAALASYAAAQRQLQQSSSSASTSTSTSPVSLPSIPECGLEGSAIEEEDEEEPQCLSHSSPSSSSIATSLDSRVSATRVAVAPPKPTLSVELPRPRPRSNEHLAVLLPKQLWKPDSRTNVCDTFLCRKAFSLFERKHHCRKCGGIFCAECSMHTTELLDTTHLEFLYPPRDVPLATFHSPRSPLAPARVCDDCYDQIHGSRVPRSPRIVKSASSASLRELPTPETAAKQSKAPSSALRPPLRRSHTSPSISGSRSRRSSRHSSPEKPQTPPPELDLGELESYPLKHHSSICKATGGGRWTPKPVRTWDGYRVPGGKAPFEIMMERKEEAERIRKANPIIRDGDIQLRAPREFDPIETTRPYILATF